MRRSSTAGFLRRSRPPQTEVLLGSVTRNSRGSGLPPRLPNDEMSVAQPSDPEEAQENDWIVLAMNGGRRPLTSGWAGSREWTKSEK